MSSFSFTGVKVLIISLWTEISGSDYLASTQIGDIVSGKFEA